MQKPVVAVFIGFVTLLAVGATARAQSSDPWIGTWTVTTRVAISADGKTLTATQAGKNAQGDTIKNVIVAERQ